MLLTARWADEEMVSDKESDPEEVLGTLPGHDQGSAPLTGPRPFKPPDLTPPPPARG